MILCPQCGKQNKNDSRFCVFCGSPIAEEPLRVCHLVLLGEGTAREYLVAGSERRIGRGPDNDIVIDDDEMSSHHARIALVEGDFWMEDLHSTNGTFVNGQRIQAATQLRDEDLLKMGHTFLKFKV